MVSDYEMKRLKESVDIQNIILHLPVANGEVCLFKPNITSIAWTRGTPTPTPYSLPYLPTPLFQLKHKLLVALGTEVSLFSPYRVGRFDK